MVTIPNARSHFQGSEVGGEKSKGGEKQGEQNRAQVKKPWPPELTRPGHGVT